MLRSSVQFRNAVLQTENLFRSGPFHQIKLFSFLFRERCELTAGSAVLILLASHFDLARRPSLCRESSDSEKVEIKLSQSLDVDMAVLPLMHHLHDCKSLAIVLSMHSFQGQWSNHFILFIANLFLPPLPDNMPRSCFVCFVFFLTIDLPGRETQGKGNQLMLSL